MWCTNSLTFNNCTLCPHCIYVFCIYLKTQSNLCHLQHKLIGFYNRDEKCLQRSTDWVFKYSSSRFVFKGLMGCHGIHVLLHSVFHWSLLYFYSRPSINFIYGSAAIWLCYAKLYAWCSTNPSTSEHTSQNWSFSTSAATMTILVWHH